MPETPETSRREKIALRLLKFFVGPIVVAVAIVMLFPAAASFVTAFFAGLGSQSPQSVIATAQNGNLDQAAQQAQQLLASGRPISDTDALLAHSIIDTNTAANAYSTGSPSAAISSIVQDYDAASSSLAKAWALNRVLDVLAGTNISLVSAPLLADPSLAPYIVTDNTPQTITQLAVFSSNIYPTSEAAYYSAFADEQYVQAYVASSSAGNIAQNLASYKKDMISKLQNGDGLELIELQYASSSPFSYSYIAATSLYRAPLLASIALIDSSYWPQAQAAFQAVYDSYTNSRDASGNRISTLLPTVAFAHLLEANFLYLAGSTKNASAIKDNLDQFVQTVQLAPNLMQSMIGSINQLKDVAMGESFVSSKYGASAWSAMSSRYALYKSFAALSPSFKTFLISEGWNIQ